MSLLVGLVFLVAWCLGMVQLFRMAAALVRRALSFTRWGARSVASPSGEPAEPRQHGGFDGR